MAKGGVKRICVTVGRTRVCRDVTIKRKGRFWSAEEFPACRGFTSYTTAHECAWGKIYDLAGRKDRKR